MEINDVLADALDRVRDSLHHILQGLSDEGLTYRPDPEANSIAWLAWHIARVQDDHVAALIDDEQLWTRDGFVDRFALPFPPEATGYGQSSEEVGAVVAPVGLLVDYYDAVHDRTVGYLRGLAPADLDRVVDRRWDPPVTLGVRLVSIINDGTQHAGQAAYLRGVTERAGAG